MISSSGERDMKPEKNPRLPLGMCVPYLTAKIHINLKKEDLPHDVGEHSKEDEAEYTSQPLAPNAQKQTSN